MLPADTSPITMEQVLFFIAAAGAILALWARIEQAITKVRDELAEFKLYVANNYASHSHLEKVEERLVEVIGELRDEVGELPERISKLLSLKPGTRKS